MDHTNTHLDALFKPTSIAVLGASTTEGSVGYSLFANLKTFPGKLYAINPNRTTVQGFKSYKSINDIPRPDLCVIATPAQTVPQLVVECGKAGVKAIIVVSAGFMETGKEGEKLGQELINTARTYGMRILGPNCLGFICPHQNINASFGNLTPLKGTVAFISQSGALGTAILDWATSRHIGFRYFVSVGSMIDIGFDDLIDYFGMDPSVNSILIYMESITKARRFMSAARAFARNKPIIVLKAGISQEGAQAAKSHTGALAGNDQAFDAAFERAGIIRVQNIEELFHTAEALALQPRPKGNRLAILTNAGGPGVLSTDVFIAHHGSLASLSPKTMNALNKILPSAWSHGNPIDILGDAPPQRYASALEQCVGDENVDGILVILTPQAMTDPLGVAQAISKIQGSGKTILASWMGGKSVEEGKQILAKAGIPVYGAPESAILAFLTMYKYDYNLQLLEETPEQDIFYSPKKIQSAAIISYALQQHKKSLLEQQAKQILVNYGFSIPSSLIAKTAGNASAYADRLGYPLAMKIISPDILHKTDAHCVKLHITTSSQARKAFCDILEAAKKYKKNVIIEGVIMEKMVDRKFEVLLGAKRDPLFGPVIMFGTGGTLVELYQDVAIMLPPLNTLLAQRLIEKTKIYTLLKGYRGQKGINLKKLQQLIVQFSHLVINHPEISEIEINPLALENSTATVLDARILLNEGQATNDTVISPYPNQFLKKILLPKGKQIILRPIKPEDEHMLAALFSSFSVETQRFRFFDIIKDISHEHLVRYTQIDYDRELSLVAETHQGSKKQIVAIVRYIADPWNISAEFSVVVSDQWRGLGIGKAATDTLLEIAKSRGIQRIYARLLPDNSIMVAMFNKRGFHVSQEKDMLLAQLEF